MDSPLGISDAELNARIAMYLGYRFEVNDGGTAFRAVTMEWETEPWRSTLEQAWADVPQFTQDTILWDQPEIIQPMAAHAWEYWRVLGNLRGKRKKNTQRMRAIAFYKVCVEPLYKVQLVGKG